MFIAIYQFDVNEGQDEQFKQAWKGLTELILKYENSLGSRLHHAKGQQYIAYAQWHSKEQWEKAGGNLPPEAEEFRVCMKKACAAIKTIHELNVVEDLLL